MSVKVVENCYGVEVSGEVRPTLDKDERMYYVHAVEDEMARAFAHHILKEKRGAIRLAHPDPIRETRTLELYIMTPSEFNLAVRKEAKRYIEATQRYPMFAHNFKSGYDL
jgi:hypothetical protein